MEFSIINGGATPQELVALKQVLITRKRQELTPSIHRSVFARPQLRRPLTTKSRFGDKSY